MIEATTGSLFSPKCATKKENEFYIVDGANNLAEIAKNAFKNVANAVNNMVYDNGNLNYIMALYNNIYRLSDPIEIKEFLKNNKYLLHLVTEAHGELQNFFPFSPVSMKVHQNELVIAVITSLSPEEADARLDEFDEKWWIDASADANARLCITVEFQ